MSGSEIKVLTLNCWGIPLPFVCKLQKERIYAIGDTISQQDFDIVLLQEVWDKTDYYCLKQKLNNKLPYSHYFFSGAGGSGVCVFSKNKILETFYHIFPLNGYAHKLFHGDWFGGKGVGLCRLLLHGLRVNLYCTHLHAEYTPHDDEYLAHRFSQAFEMSQFIKLTSNLDICDVVILGGDLNLQPKDLGYKVIKSNSNLIDSWLVKHGENGGQTCDCPTNSFVSAYSLAMDPKGKRIDYILYRGNKGFDVRVKTCEIEMGQIPGKDYNFSDHEAVLATLTVKKDPDCKGSMEETVDMRTQQLNESVSVLNAGLKKMSTDNMFYNILAVISVFLLYFLSSVDFPYGFGWVRGSFLVFLTLLFGFSIWNRVIVNKIEEHGLMATKENLTNLLKQKGD